MIILFIGDITGKTGREAVAKILPRLREKHRPDLVAANGENIAHGKGLTLSTFRSVLEAGVDFFTSGNHIFDKPEAKEVFETYGDKIIRPANYMNPDLPGRGHALLRVGSASVLFINLNGQVFMEKQFDYGEIANPFLKLNEILTAAGSEARIRILDFHAEATSEKKAMGLWADGRLSAVIGTHTHVPTADAQILPQGTGYLTDAGMTGAAHSVIGVEKEGVLRRFLSGERNGKKIPVEVAESNQYEVGYCVLEIDEQTGKCQNIERHWEVFAD